MKILLLVAVLLTLGIGSPSKADDHCDAYVAILDRMFKRANEDIYLETLKICHARFYEMAELVAEGKAAAEQCGIAIRKDSLTLKKRIKAGYQTKSLTQCIPRWINFKDPLYDFRRRLGEMLHLQRKPPLPDMD